MRYTYILYPVIGGKFVTTRLEDIENELQIAHSKSGFCVEVYDNRKQAPNDFIKTIHTPDALEEWRQSLERVTAWKPFDEKETGIHMRNTNMQTTDAVNPSHYQSYVDEYQWIEVMARIPGFREANSERFKGALELQIRKYLDRLGRKDESIQELKKAQWYLTYLIAFMENGCKPVHVADVMKRK